MKGFLSDFCLFGESPADWARIAKNWPEVRTEAAKRAARGQAYAAARTWDAMIDEMCEDLGFA